ncbi:16S rRNA (cytidine(1402)-2'-O)-methyltransferase [Candidatus Parcubacteria bacterium]|nr:16S rRNA (cytidine(1402)-2'-O)-methyltransferase [Candidatus Parcubacteria bacterium]
MSNLYIVATPIGNLEDMTLRAIRVLGEVDFILSEDTRVTGKLLKHYEIKTKTYSFHEHSNDDVYEKILEQLKDGKDFALVSDAGTPGISDPGSRLINFLREKENAGEISDLNIIPLPGASALSSAVSVAGLHGSEFYFAGFAPKKKGKQTFLKSLPELTDKFGAVVFFESGHRILKTIKGVEEFYPATKTEPKITLAKELTKIHEKIIKGTSVEIINYLNDEKHQKGEFVVIVE